ncbi:MAG: LysE family transporter [Synechococcales cyanobacterium C42_A2020_086]|jgi:threonine/homoserine/homoserine lactone efflux protein|nr:LysE family transporter [Synechococcales cyanobacterium C42_A2020_086]
MDAMFFLRGLIIGFSIAAPVGPIGILAIRRTLAEGWLVGLLTGLGAATADAIYGAIAGFGLTLVSTLLIEQATGLRLIGGIFLCLLGVKTFAAKPPEQAAAIKQAAATNHRGLLGAYLSTVGLTLTNPLTILSFAAVFSGLGLATSVENYGSAGILVAGVFLGSALWWLLLSSGANWLKSRFNPRRLSWLNRISGLILLVFGIIALSSL